MKHVYIMPADELKTLQDNMPPPFRPIAPGAVCEKCKRPASRWMDCSSGDIETICEEWPGCQEVTP